jgi:hypothetical protein
MLDPVVDKGELTETDRFIFESWGYFLIPDVLTKDEAAEAYEVSQRLHQNRGREFGQLGRTYESEPVLERLIDHPDVLSKARPPSTSRTWDTRFRCFSSACRTCSPIRPCPAWATWS